MSDTKTIREQLEADEELVLSPFAQKSVAQTPPVPIYLLGRLSLSDAPST